MYYPSGKVTYTFQVVANQYPIKKQTVKEVLDRIFETVEPLCYNDTTKARVRKPRFALWYKYSMNTPEGKAERAMFNRISPEFAFTHMTLREALQEVGKFIHAEPRLISAKTGAITFDRYGLQQVATYKNMYETNGQHIKGFIYPFTTHPYAGKRLVSDINTANTKIESDVDNFVNRLDGLGGTIAEPYRNGAITLRTDQAYLRFEDDESSLYFPTQKPIMDITSLKWVDIIGIAGTIGAKYEITPYVFEKTAYDAELSSYTEQYPRSKAFGLYYTQGERHIRGFFFKNEKWNKDVFSQYAIRNILERVTNKTLSISSYPQLAFELVYTPIYGARLSHGKTYTGDLLKKPMALSYNQSANVIETRYYGEHIKGVAQRLGNVEKTIVIHLRSVQNIPKIGQKWDDEYYISDVKSRFNSDRVICNVGLTKNFNRLSEYVGANSYKRYYEVSERMSKERRTLYKDYLVITDKLPYAVEKDCFITSSTLSAVANTFYQTTAWTQFVREITSCVVAQGFTKSLQPLTSILLPVVSSAFGNVMEFTWSYKDNYSAGVSSTYQDNGKTGNDKVSGYFGAEVPYGDYYGQMYYQRYSLQNRKENEEAKKSLFYTVSSQIAALSLPQNTNLSVPVGDSLEPLDNITEVAGTPEGIYRIIRKDSREVLTQSYAMEYVTDKKNIIIGSALARNNPMIGGIPNESAAALWILPDPVNQFSDDEIDLTTAVR
ncbi:MAG: hypothetical protein K2L87_04785, partial [Clostridiales bacterium]|nr:hypothetical protein [Clostridiales bacterium]